MPYLGNPPAEAYTTTVKDSFSGDGSTTAFTLSQPSTTNDLRVVVENVIQDPTVAYSVSGTTLTFTSAPPTGTNNIYAVNLGPAVQTVTPPAEIGNATTFNSSVTVQGAFTSPGIDDNATSTAMTIDSSGNAIVGSTSSDPVNDGIRLKPAGQVTSTINADVALLLNRRVSDGTIAQFRQDNAVVGSIGSLTSGRDLHVNSTGGILTFESNFNSTERQVVFGDTYLGPRAADNNAVDLGRSVSQFKELYLSGGVFLGGTGSANKLSDVEEGSWTPSVGGNATYNAQTGKYIKIGNQVTCWFNIYVNSLGTGSHVTVTGLPFTVSNITEFNANGNSMTYWSNINTACTYLAVKLDKNTTQFQFTNTTTATTTVGTTVSVYKDGADTYGTFTYRTG